MNVNPLLFVMFPRRIQRCVGALNALDIDKVYLSCMWQAEIAPEIARIVREHDEYTHFLIISDDGAPEQQALDRVLWGLDAGFPVVTGYCNLDEKSPLVNLTSRPFAIKDRPVWSDYAWMGRAEVEAYPGDYITTHFAGLALTGMSREMWLRYPFAVITKPDDPRGYGSDWYLCRRLQDDGVSIVAPVGAFMEHLKEDSMTQAVTDRERRLLIGKLPPEVQWSLRDGTAWIEPMRGPRIHRPTREVA